MDPLRKWITDCPCVRDKRVLVDVRGPWPVAYIGMKAVKVQEREDFIAFVINNVDTPGK